MKPSCFFLTLVIVVSAQSPLDNHSASAPECPGGAAGVLLAIELANVTAPASEKQEVLARSMFLSRASHYADDLRLQQLGEYVRIDVLACESDIGPAASYRLAATAQSVLGGGAMRWSAIAQPPPKNDDLRLYFSMMGNISEHKELVASHKTNLSEAHIWRVGANTRLMLNNVVMSDTQDEYAYHEMLVHPALLAVEMPRRVLIIGGGEGAVLREVLRDQRVESVTMVDLDEGLVNMCREHLAAMHRGSFDSPRAVFVFDDGAEFVKRSPPQSFDVIIVDGIDLGDEDDISEYGSASYGNVLFTPEFYSAAHRLLHPGGTIVQYMSQIDKEDNTDDLLSAGFSIPLTFCIDVDSFYGAGACFALSAKSPAEPLLETLKRRIPLSAPPGGWLFLTPDVFDRCLMHTVRRLKGAGASGVGRGGGSYDSDRRRRYTVSSTGRHVFVYQRNGRTTYVECHPEDEDFNEDTGQCEAVESGACFPGEASVEVRGQGGVDLASLRVGDEVLVEKLQNSKWQLVYEPIIAFLHASRATKSRFLVIKHAYGEFRVFATHIVFVANGADGRSRLDKPAAELKIGDQLFMASSVREGADVVLSEVLHVKQAEGELGFYAPMTSAGTIVIDGVVASTYAVPSLGVRLSHRLAHAALLPVRAYHALGFPAIVSPMLSWLCQGAGLGSNQRDAEELHPWLALLWRVLRLQVFLPST